MTICLFCINVNQMEQNHNIFFAYESGHIENIEAIRAAISEYNNYTNQSTAISWEDLNVNGKIISKIVLDEIEKCSFFACDLTFISHNVIFELGYAIGKRKDLLVFLNDSVSGKLEEYRSIKIFNNLGFTRFSSSKQIHKELQSKEQKTKNFLANFLNLDEKESNSGDILHIASKIENQASISISNFFSSVNYKIITLDNSEVVYQTLLWYVKNINKAKAVIIHLLGADKKDYLLHNAEYSFFAGVALALGKEVLLIAPAPFKAPIDYHDILIEYGGSSDCIKKVEGWINRSKKLNLISTTAITNTDNEITYNLLKLGLGIEIAEDEKENLIHYFVETDAYKKAFDRPITIFVGRKGSGKSATFIKLEKDLEQEEINYNVILKPDSDELLENVAFKNIHNSEISKRNFYYIVWKFVIYSKLLLCIYEKIEKKSKLPGFNYSETDMNIVDFKEKNENILSLNFFGAIKYLNDNLEGKTIHANPEIIDELHKKCLTDLVNIIKHYFKNRSSYQVSILADNLDKAWDSKNDLQLQGEMILRLLEFSDKIINELVDNKKEKKKVYTIIFLRKDIFEFILKFSRERDKLVTRCFEIDWEAHPILLRKIIEKRFLFVLDKKESEINKIWEEYFDFKKEKKQNTYESLSKFLVKRPRDFIFFFSKLFESAVNNGNKKVNDLDVSYAIDAYTIFLHNNLLAEMKAEFPFIETLFHNLQKDHYGSYIKYSKFKSLVMSLGITEEFLNRLLDSLFEKKYIVAFNQSAQIYEDLNELNKAILEKKFYFWDKNEVSLILNPQVYSIKNRSMWG